MNPPPPNPHASAPDFLAGGGELGALTRTYDWTRSGLGPPDAWPQSLKTAVHLVLSTPHPMFIWWGPELIQFYNDAYRQTMGPERHPSALGQPGRACWEEIWPIISPQIEQVMAGGGATSHESQLVPVTRHGQRRDVWWTYSYNPINDAGGVGGVLVICQDVTEQVIAERQSASNRERLEQMFQQAPTFMTMLSGPDHRFELANPGYYKLIGQREILGRTVAEVLPEAVAQGYIHLLDGVYRNGVAFSALGSKFTFQATPDAPVEEHFLDFVYQPITGAGGTVTGIFVEGVDVTERVKAEVRRDALIALTDKFRDLRTRGDIAYAAAETLGETLGASRVGYGTVDHDTETVNTERDWTAPGVPSRAGRVNLRTFGSWVDELKNNELVHMADIHADPRTAGAGAAALAARGVRAFVNMPVVEHGRLVAILFVATPEVRAWSRDDLPFIREVAERTRTAVERVRNEAALREANENLEAKIEIRTRELMQAEEALRQSQKMEAIGQLTGGIAHDFNNLLAAITGSLEFIEKRIAEGRPETADRFIAGAQGAAKRAAALTQRLLAFSRRQTLDPKPTDVNRLIHGMEDLLRRSVGPDIAVEVIGAGGLWATKIDPSQLENALLNLCINGRDAMAPRGGRLIIETANAPLDDRAARERDLAPGEYISLCVTDTGTGMEPAVIARAFDPFFTTKPLGEGTGLGLSMVYGFARQSGGQIRIQSELGKGTTMCLYLPRHTGQVDTEEEETKAALDQGDGETVLIVDDEQTIRMLVVEVLEEAGYATIEAHDGPSALKLLQSNVRIDLLITDVGLPGGMNGRQIADAARQARPGLKVIFITGFAANTAIGNGHLDSGMEIMTKPFTMTALGNKVREVLER